MYSRKSRVTLSRSVSNDLMVIINTNCFKPINISFSSLSYDSLFYAEFNLKRKVYVFVTKRMLESLRDLVRELCLKK